MHSISFDRLLQLVKRRAILNAKGSLTLWGPAAVCFVLAAFIVDGDEVGGDIPFFLLWYMLAVFVIGYRMVTHSLSIFKNANGRQSYLMLPASNAEKWFVTYLVTGPLFVVFITGAYWLLSSIVNIVLYQLGFATYVAFDPFSTVTLDLVKAYLGAWQPIALLGAISFNSHPGSKTLGVSLAFLFGLALVAAVTFRITYRKYFEGLFNVGHIEGNIDDIYTGIPGLGDWSGVVIGLALLAASYFKFQEKQV